MPALAAVITKGLKFFDIINDVAVDDTASLASDKCCAEFDRDTYHGARLTRYSNKFARVPMLNRRRSSPHMLSKAVR
jgi:hypothetical protein